MADIKHKMRFFARLILPVAVIVTVLSYADSPAEPRPEARLAMSGGGVSLWNSHNGSAIFNVGNLGPGDSSGGQVSLSNTGTASGDLKLTQADLVDSPGPYGGQLSGVVQLAVLDQTNGNAVVYSGPLQNLGERALVRLGPGQSRSYYFAMTLPDGGAGDNAFRGSSLTTRYRWDLVEVPGAGGPSPDDGVDWDETGWVGNPVIPMRMQGRMSVKLALRKGIINIYLRCSEPCRLKATAGLLKRKRLTAKAKSLRQPVPRKRTKISLKLSKKALKVLRARVGKKGKDHLTVKVVATDPRGGKLTMTKKKVIKGKKKRWR